MIHCVVGALMRLTLFKVFFLIFILVGLDQLTKFYILMWASEGTIPLSITSFFQLVIAWNRGISFGMFNSFSPSWIHHAITFLAVCISLMLVSMLFQKKWATQRFALVLIIAGAIGNLIDRFYHGAVVDFLDFHWHQYHWPAFNVADTLITVGVALILWHSVRDASRAD